MLKIVTRNELLLRTLRKGGLLARVIQADLRLLNVTGDRLLVDRLIESLWVDHGQVSKESAPGRFRDIDAILARRLQRIPSLLVHDVAVSHGLTSLDLLTHLRATGLSPRLYISDKFSRCIHVQHGLISRVYDTQGGLLCGRVSFISADPKASWHFPISRLLFHALKSTPTRGDATRTEISLYSQAVGAALKSGDVIHLDYDIFTGTVDVSFDVVRCMNAITRKYFPADRIAQGIANLRRSMKPSGLLLVGRTMPGGQNNATLFQLDSGRFVPDHVINDGADIHDIVVGLPATSV